MPLKADFPQSPNNAQSHPLVTPRRMNLRWKHLKLYWRSLKRENYFLLHPSQLFSSNKIIQRNWSLRIQWEVGQVWLEGLGLIIH